MPFLDHSHRIGCTPYGKGGSTQRIRQTGRQSMFRLSVVVAASACALSAMGQNVTRSGYFGFLVSVDSQNASQDALFPDGDPSTGPVSHDVSLSFPEPLGGSHESTSVGTLSSTGTVWTGIGSMIAEYPTSLTPGVDLPGNGTGTATLLGHSLDFTLSQPTNVSITAFADLILVDPVNPNRLNGLSLRLTDSLDAEIYSASLDDFRASGTKSADDSILLQPGSYGFSMAATIAALDTVGSRSVNLDYDYSIEFQPIPAPASSVFLTLAGLATARRRRRLG